MKLNPFVKAGIGLTFALLWSCPTLAALTEAKNFGLEVKTTAQSDDDRDLGTQKGGDVNGIGLDLRPWVYGESGAWSAYAMGQAVTSSDIIETDTLQQSADDTTEQSSNDDRKAKKNYLALREFWVGYSGFTPYPGEILKFGRQRLRNDDGKLDYAEPGVASDPLDKRENGDLTWLGIEANSDAYNWRNTNTVNYWASITGMRGDRDKVNALTADGERPAQAKNSDDLSGWATDIGVRLRLDPQWQVGAAYARASADYEQNGLQSNRSNWTGTQSRVHRFGEAFRGEMNNMQSMSLFGSWQLREDYDASLVYHKFWRVDGNKPVSSSGIAALDNTTNAAGDIVSSTSLPLADGKKDLGQEMDLVVTKYFKKGLLPAALSQSIDEPSALVRFRAGVFKPGDAYGSKVDSYMHRAFVDVVWKF